MWILRNMRIKEALLFVQLLSRILFCFASQILKWKKNRSIAVIIRCQWNFISNRSLARHFIFVSSWNLFYWYYKYYFTWLDLDVIISFDAEHLACKIDSFELFSPSIPFDIKMILDTYSHIHSIDIWFYHRSDSDWHCSSSRCRFCVTDTVVLCRINPKK